MSTLSPILVIDSDDRFLGEIESDKLYGRFPAYLAKDFEAAQACLADGHRSLGAVVFNPRTAYPGGIPMIKAVRKQRPLASIYFLSEGRLSIGTRDLVKLGIEACLVKPMTYSQILAKLYRRESIEPVASEASEGELEQEVKAEDSHFVPVKAQDFLLGTRSYFDTYVGLSSGRYIKILKAGEVFARERLEKYLAKKVNYFYIRHQDQERYLNFCDLLAQNLIKSAKVPTESKVQATLAQGDQTLSFLARCGVSATNLNYARAFVGNVEEMIRRDNLRSNLTLDQFLGDLRHYEHSVAVTLVVALLARQLAIRSEKTLQVVSITSFFHDLGLLGASDTLRNEEVLKMSPEELTLFHEHPLKGAKMLEAIPSIDPITVQAVAQHHERRSKHGFPLHLGAGAINKVAEIIGISDEFLRLSEETSQEKGMTLAQRMETQVFQDFSFDVTEAFRKVFTT